MTAPLTPAEYDALSPDDRAFLDDAWAQLDPSQESQVRALTMLIRGIVKHDTAGLHTALPGVFELQDRADEAARELTEAATELRQATAAMVARVEGAITDLRADVRDLRDADATLTRRLAAQERLSDRRFWLLVGIAIAAAIDLVFRYGPLILSTLLSAVILIFTLRRYL